MNDITPTIAIRQLIEAVGLNATNVTNLTYNAATNKLTITELDPHMTPIEQGHLIHTHRTHTIGLPTIKEDQPWAS